MSLSLSDAWDETAAVAKARAPLLFGLAFLLMALPSAILQALAPVTAPGRLPQPGPWLLLVPVVLIASLIGGLGICRVALRADEGPSTALGAGLRRLLPLLGAASGVGIVAVAALAVSLPLAAMLAFPWLLSVPLVLLAFCWVRLILLTPVAAAEPLGPLALLRRTWALTAGQFLALLSFLLVAALLSLAALFAAGALGGVGVRLATGEPQPGLLPFLLVLFVSAVLQAAIAGLFTAFLARLYAQLAGPSRGS
jgi:hypothetical protein